MSRKRTEHVLFEHVEITDTSSDGNAVGKHEGKVVFVEHAVPGDVVDVLVYKNKKNFAEGRATKFHTLSELRVKPFCEHFGTCGGCKWQNLEYSAQLGFKQKQVSDALTRIGDLTLPSILPILGSEKIKFYRNKLEFSFSDKRWLSKDDMGVLIDVESSNALGLHIPKRFDKVLDVKNCYLQPDPSNSIRLVVKKFTEENQYTYYNLREQKGMMRNLFVRTTSTGETMVAVVFGEDEKRSRDKLMSHIDQSFPGLKSLLYLINTKKNDTIYDLKVERFAGEETITENIGGIKFRIGLKSFFQTNMEQTKVLYDLIRNWTGPERNEIIYDLYTGTGTIANYVAGNAGKVIGIEYIESAIEDARVNSSINEISNTEFVAGDIKETLTPEFYALHGKPDVIITDPPRAGMHEDVTKSLAGSGTRKIIYVSCNPATQARDLKIMEENYSIEKVQPMDMFPHTSHVENVVLLKKR